MPQRRFREYVNFHLGLPLDHMWKGVVLKMGQRDLHCLCRTGMCSRTAEEATLEIVHAIRYFQLEFECPVIWTGPGILNGISPSDLDVSSADSEVRSDSRVPKDVWIYLLRFLIREQNSYLRMYPNDLFAADRKVSR